MAGSRFVRADVHVHLLPESGTPPGDPAAYVAEALAQGIAVLGITDHNSIANVGAMLAAAEGHDLLVLPGIEVTTHQGHLIALFAPDAVSDLADFHRSLNLRPDPADGSLRADQSLLQLVGEVHGRGGLGILAHVDRESGIQARVSTTELTQLLAHEGLAGIEFVDARNLEKWFTTQDDEPSRLRAWTLRQHSDELRARGLARVMSSDAHDASLVGKEGDRRPLTKLRLDDLNFTAVRTALLYNPKGRCKAEAVLPPGYPQIISAAFTGGFLDGVTLDFSPNLTCLIGGRGSGKSTALLAIRAALGAPRRATDEDPDAPERMPDTTVVRFKDAAGLERTTIRERGRAPYDENGDPIRLVLADLAQDESGDVARAYREAPERLLTFLDSFCELGRAHERERGLLARLAENGEQVLRTSFRDEEIKELVAEQQQLAAQFKAAEGSRLEDVAIWARELATQAALITRVRESIAELIAPQPSGAVPRLKSLAETTQTDLDRLPIRPLVPAIEAAIAGVNAEALRVGSTRVEALRQAALPLEAQFAAWETGHAEFKERLDAKQAELESQGLKVEVGEIRRLGRRMEEVGKSLSTLQQRRRAHGVARLQRKGLLRELHGNRDEIHGTRRSTLRSVAAEANDGSLGLKVSVSFEHHGQRGPWIDWLRGRFAFRSPRVERLAMKASPQEFATAWQEDFRPILNLIDDAGDGTPFFSQSQLEGGSLTWSDVFGLETMLLEDRPRIVIEEVGRTRREFDGLSAGQQRSVLLSLLLFARGNEPIVIDQPEDHLDAPYIANAIVYHLERVKERRQVLIATHSANLTVLGDAELVIPLYAEGGRGSPRDVGAVDRPATLKRVCELLEGGATAYRRRGERYGFRFATTPPV